jgi:hypothetical protein
MLYLLTFAAGVIAGGVGVVAWFSWAEKSDAPPFLADILKNDQVAPRDRRLIR